MKRVASRIVSRTSNFMQKELVCSWIFGQKLNQYRSVTSVFALYGSVRLFPIQEIQVVAPKALFWID